LLSLEPAPHFRLLAHEIVPEDTARRNLRGSFILNSSREFGTMFANRRNGGSV